MGNSSRTSFLFVFLASILGGAACGERTPSDSPEKPKEVAAASTPAPSSTHTADNLATETVERDRNEQQQADDTKSREAFDVSTKKRLANIDKSLAMVSASKNAPGLRVRRDEVAARLAKMPATVDDTWVKYTREVTQLLDGIERDVRAAR